MLILSLIHIWVRRWWHSRVSLSLPAWLEKLSGTLPTEPPAAQVPPHPDLSAFCKVVWPALSVGKSPDVYKRQVVLQVLSNDVETAFLAKEVALLASDPDEGDVV